MATAYHHYHHFLSIADTKMPDIVLASLVISQCILFILGTSLNLILVLITLKSRSLRSMFNYLFAFLAVFQIFHFSGILLFIASTYLEISNNLCFHLSIPSALGAFTSTVIPVIMAIDRVIATCKPNQWAYQGKYTDSLLFRYKSIKNSEFWYISFLVSFSLFYASWIVFCAYLTHKKATDSAICVLSEAFGASYLLYAMTSLSFFIITFPLLAFVHYRMKSMEYDSANFYLFRAILISTAIFYTSIAISHGILLICPSKTQKTKDLLKICSSTVQFLLQTFIVPVFCYYVQVARAHCNINKDYLQKRLPYCVSRVLWSQANEESSINGKNCTGRANEGAEC